MKTLKLTVVFLLFLGGGLLPSGIEETDRNRIPTFIFSHAGEEIGRIVENPRDSMLEDILGILSRMR